MLNQTNLKCSWGSMHCQSNPNLRRRIAGLNSPKAVTTSLFTHKAFFIAQIKNSGVGWSQPGPSHFWLRCLFQISTCETLVNISIVTWLVWLTVFLSCPEVSGCNTCTLRTDALSGYVRFHDCSGTVFPCFFPPSPPSPPSVALYRPKLVITTTNCCIFQPPHLLTHPNLNKTLSKQV